MKLKPRPCDEASNPFWQQENAAAADFALQLVTKRQLPLLSLSKDYNALEYFVTAAKPWRRK